MSFIVICGTLAFSVAHTAARRGLKVIVKVRGRLKCVLHEYLRRRPVIIDGRSRRFPL